MCPSVLRATWVRSPPPPGDGSHAYRIPRHRFFQDIDGACFLEIKEEPMFKTLVAFWTDPLVQAIDPGARSVFVFVAAAFALGGFLVVLSVIRKIGYSFRLAPRSVSRCCSSWPVA